ncbi:MAG: glycosyltransferase family 2 protein [Planctomycetota bacterium]
MNVPPVTAVIVTYRSADTIGTALGALRASHDAGLVRTIVVDNASDDGTADLVRQQYPWVEVLDSGGNVGFARGNNVALRRLDPATSGPFVLLLNPDAALAEADLRQLIEFLDARPEVGIVGPALDNRGGSPALAHPFPTPGSTLRHALGRVGNDSEAPPLIPGTPPQRVDWICGAAMLIRTSVVRALDGFDDRFFLYFEETDLCYRAHRAGHEIWVLGEAVAVHHVHASARTAKRELYFGCIAEHYFRSRYYYLVKHYGRVRASAVEAATFVLTAARALAKRLRGQPPGELLVRLRAPFLRSPERAPQS